MAGLQRHQRLVYLNCAEGYELIGKGFTGLNVSGNAKTEEKHWVHEQNATGGLSGYAPAMAFVSEMDDTDPVSLYLQEIADTFDIGVKAHTDIVIVDTWKNGTTSGTKAARKQDVVISIDNPGSGEAGSALALTGTFTYDGDPVQGEFNPSTKTFTEKSAA